MRSRIVSLITAVMAFTLLPETAARAEGGKATIENLKCGPSSWHRPTCAACKEGETVYTVTKFVEGAIAVAHEELKELTDPQKEVEAMAAVLGAKHKQQKRWQEQQKDGEMTDTYCWEPVKAEEIKPLKDKGYGLGMFYDGRCRVEADRCYQFTMECRKQREATTWTCNPSLQEFIAKDGKCEGSPTAHACDCQPSVYWKCGSFKGGADKGAKGAKPRKGKGKR